MFRLVRLVVLCMMAFVAGVFYERLNAKEACDAIGGVETNGLCITTGAQQ